MKNINNFRMIYLFRRCFHIINTAKNSFLILTNTQRNPLLFFCFSNLMLLLFAAGAGIDLEQQKTGFQCFGLAKCRANEETSNWDKTQKFEVLLRPFDVSCLVGGHPCSRQAAILGLVNHRATSQSKQTKNLNF